MINSDTTEYVLSRVLELLRNIKVRPEKRREWYKEYEEVHQLYVSAISTMINGNVQLMAHSADMGADCTVYIAQCYNKDSHPEHLRIEQLMIIEAALPEFIDDLRLYWRYSEDIYERSVGHLLKLKWMRGECRK